MNLTLTPMTEAYAAEIVSWQYSAPYDIYNLTKGDIATEINMLLSTDSPYYAVLDEGGELVGFCCYGSDAQVPGGDYRNEAVDVGLGMRPDLVGQGLGAEFVQVVLSYAEIKTGALRFRATIAAFNSRCRRLFEKAGFQQEQVFKGAGADGMEFVVVAKEGIQ